MRVRWLLLTAGILCTAGASSATFTVTNTNDSGAGSLRQAILDANGDPGADAIDFNIPGAGVHTITLASGLPYLSTPMTIDGYTQSGSQPNTNATGGLNSVIEIEIQCSSGWGVFMVETAVTVRGVAVGGCAWGVEIAVGASLTLAGNYFGTDASGTTRRQNSDDIIMWTQLGSGSVTIGGPLPADRNLISGSQYAGIRIGGNFNGFDNVVVQGNIIGLDRTATVPIPNSWGFITEGAPSSSVIGGINPGEGNIIAGNTGRVSNSTGWAIGVATTDHIVRIRGNSIFGNDAKGIQLAQSGASPLANDPGDGDDGGNDRQNFPILQTVTILAPQAGTRIQGVLHSKPSTTYDLDFYENPACSNFPREFLQGQSYIGSGQVATDGSGNGVFDVTVPATVAAGARVSATATDPGGNTSEFSQRIIFSINPSSGPAAGGTTFTVSGTDFADPTTLTVDGVPATGVTFVNDHTLSGAMPAFAPGTSHDVVAATPDGTTGTLIKGWVADFLDVSESNQFYSYITTLVSNGITAGIGGGLYGVDNNTLRQQMAVFLLKARHGLCYTPPPCTGIFGDVPCPSTFADWVEALSAEGITGGCGGGNFCPQNPVRRDQMAVFLLKSKYGSSYVPPDCTGVFFDVACPSPFANWIEQLAVEQITGGCGGGNYCPLSNNTRGQMAVFIVKTFSLN